MATTIKMPQLGESVTEGTIERWLVKEGDTVEQYDPLFEVVTDKVNAEVPAEVAGTITKIMVPDGETVAVGTPWRRSTPRAAQRLRPRMPRKHLLPRHPAEAPAAEAPPAEAQREAPLPGRPADAGVPAEPPSRERGAAPRGADSAREEPDASGQPRAGTRDAEAAGGAPPTDGSMRMTPAVRRLVREHKLDVARITGTGAGGRVTRDDVMQLVAQGGQPAAAAPSAQAAAPAGAPAPWPRRRPHRPPRCRLHARGAPPAPVPTPSGGDTEMTLSQMRKGIAAKMTQVKQTVPHAYTVVEVDMGNVVRWREANQGAYKAREGIGISYVAALSRRSPRPCASTRP